jgi:hypothetical protein
MQITEDHAALQSHKWPYSGKKKGFSQKTPRYSYGHFEILFKHISRPISY